MHLFPPFLLFIGILTSGVCSYGQSTELMGKSTEGLEDTVRLKKSQFIPLPVIYYTPETHLALGTLGVFLFKADKHARTSNIDFLIMYSQNKQVIIDPNYSIFTKGEKYFLKGNILYTKFPEYFYGIGNETARDTKEDIDYKTFRVYNRILRQIRPKLFVGFQQQYFKTFDVKFKETTQYTPGSIPGEKGSVTSGFGPSIVYDTRDNILNSTKGTYAEFSTVFYNKSFGSQFEFANYLLDVRQFKRMGPKSVIAFQELFNFNVGDVPFKQLATIGGFSAMRGYYNGRYRDKDLIVFQTEWRQRIYKRFGIAIFGAVGDVVPQVQDFSLGDMKTTVGAGLRFQLSRKENLNIRLDAGFGNNTQGFYLNISEAF